MPQFTTSRAGALWAALLACLLVSCEEGGSKKNSGDANPGSQTFNPTTGCMPQTNSVPGQQQGIPGGQQQPGQVNPGTGAMQLQAAETTYEVDIKPILKARCFDACHNGTNASAGSWNGTGTELDYNKVSENMNLIANVVDGELNHQEPLNLSPGEISKFAAWEADGFPRGQAPQDPVPGNNGVNPANPGGVTPGNPCTSVSGQTPLPGGTTIGTDPLDSLVNSEVHKQCQSAGKMTDRNNDQCFEDIPLDMSWCNDAGIQAKFDELALAGQAMAAEITRLKGEGYAFEGCGVQAETNHPHVSWIKKDPAGERILFHVSKGTPPQ